MSICPFAFLNQFLRSHLRRCRRAVLATRDRGAVAALRHSGLALVPILLATQRVSVALPDRTWHSLQEPLAVHIAPPPKAETDPSAEAAPRKRAAFTAHPEHRQRRHPDPAACAVVVQLAQ